MKNIIILGVNEYSEYVYYTMLKEGYKNIIAFSSYMKFIDRDTFCGLPVYAIEELGDRFFKSEFEVLIAIGYTKMNTRREKAYNDCIAWGYKIHTFISSRSICDSNEVGEGSIVMPTAYIPPCTKIGKCNIINMGTYITHTGIIGDFNWFAATIVMGGNIKMGNNCFIGMGCTLKNGIYIASRTFVGAGSYLSDDTLDGLAYIGTPAVNKKNLKSDIVIDFV